jgi:hypothetical protein
MLKILEYRLHEGIDIRASDSPSDQPSCQGKVPLGVLSAMFRPDYAPLVKRPKADL